MRGVKAALLMLLLAVSASSQAADGDVPGSSDYAPIGRFEGSVILGYKDLGFNEYRLHNGPAKQAGDKSNNETIKGRIRMIAYEGRSGASLAEVYRDYRQKLEEAGFRVGYKCYDKSCGGERFANSVSVLPQPGMVVDPGNFRYLNARSITDGRQVDAVVLISQDKQRQPRIQFTVIESGDLSNKTVVAEEMLKGLAEFGHIALYGIYFDPGKADLKPESQPVMEEISRLMQAQKNLKLILVGHTDNQGTYDDNMILSDQRARAVVNALVSEYGIPSSRMRSNGVGYLAPVATNITEEGRALNRRVELVQAK